ncbi:hypothetical protein G3M74_22060 [Paenibacillus polymyxa]|nr:hypothetical protein [Paenibacillus polymyxa]
MSLNSIIFIGILYFIKQDFSLFGTLPVPTWISHLILIIFPIPLSLLILQTSKYLNRDSIKSIIIQIEQANNAYLPSYLGYFFVALSIPDSQTFIFVFLILFVFVYFSQTQYFNPVFLLLKYHFYFVTTEDNSKNIIISKRILKNPKEVEFEQLRRINYYTYIDEEVD